MSRNLSKPKPRSFEKISLTDTVLKSLRAPEGGVRIVADGLCPGLHVRIGARGKSWFVRYRVDNRRQERNIGAFPDVSLSDARKLATDIRSAAKSDKDLLAVNAAAAARARSVSDVLADYFTEHLEGRSKSIEETRRLHRLHVVPAIGHMQIGKVTFEDLYRLREKVRTGTGGVQSNRVVAAVKAFFRWAHERRRIIDVNPSAGLDKAVRETPRERALSLEEAALVWIAAEYLDTPTWQLVQFMMLTGARRDEVREMDWSEIDLDRGKHGVWTLPKERNKTKVRRETPLTKEARAILDGLHDGEGGVGPVFVGRDGLDAIKNVQRAKQRLDRLLDSLSKFLGRDEPEPWVFHDLRRTVGTHLGRLGVSGETIARVLGHSEGAILGVTAVYARSDYLDQKLDALERWEAALLEEVARMRSALDGFAPKRKDPEAEHG